MKAESSRLVEIDVAKGIGIILVVIGHNWLLINHYLLAKHVIYSFHVPLFFFLSGLIFKVHEDVASLVIKKMLTLLKPYLIVLITYEFCRFILGKTELVSPFLGIVYATGQSIQLTPLWFLPHLFLVTLFSNLLIKYLSLEKNSFTLHALIIGSLVLGIYVLHALSDLDIYRYISFHTSTNLPLGLPLSIDLLLISTAFFLSGYTFWDTFKTMQASFFYFALSVVIVLLINFFFSPSLDLNSRVYENPISTSIAAFAGILMVITTSKILSKYIKSVSEILSYIGSASLFILIFHGIIQGWLAYKFDLLVPGYPYIAVFFSASVAVIFSWVIFYMTNQSKKLRSIFL